MPIGRSLEPRDVPDLLGRERVQPELVLGLHPAKEILVPGDGQIGVEPALQEDLHASGVDHLLQLLPQHFAAQHVAFGVPDRPVEGAEAAARGANVGVVDVAIDDVRDHALGVLLLAHGIGGKPHIEE